MALDFDNLYAEHAEALWRLARRMTGRDDEAADVVQAAFLKAMTRGGWRGLASPRAWLMAIARNEALDRLRRRGRLTSLDAAPPVASSEPSALRRLLDDENARRLWTALERLGERDRELVHLRYQDGLSPTEIGAVLGLRDGAARTALHRALNRLRALSEEIDDDDVRKTRAG